jgi:catechol 2,3-dioxygenase-like lactoylglutathione lyase family enzyme
MPALPSSDPEQFVQGAPVLHVPDVSATVAFYRDVLGFTCDFGDDTYAVVWRDNSAIHFVRDEGGGIREFGLCDINGVEIVFGQDIEHP